MNFLSQLTGKTPFEKDTETQLSNITFNMN